MIFKNTKTAMVQLICAAGLCLVLGFLMFSTSTETNAKEPKIVAKVNDFELTRDEYEAKLVRELEFEQVYKSTHEARKEFLGRLIRQEILIQEAVSLNLDKDPAFIDAIEKYWEATLIKKLMEAKIKEIKQKTFITEQEIRDRYRQLKTKKQELPPLDQVEKKIAALLKEEKLTATMDQWVNGLQKDAKVRIFEKYL